MLFSIFFYQEVSYVLYHKVPLKTWLQGFCVCLDNSLPLTGSVVAQRSDHGTSAPPMLQAAASAAGAPLVASPYPQSYLQYNPQQYGQQQVIQAMTPYPGQVGRLVSDPFLKFRF